MKTKDDVERLMQEELRSIREAEEIAGVKLKGQGATPEKAILNDVLPLLMIAKISQVYFGESSTWLNRKLNGLDHDGNAVPPLSPSERATLKNALMDISKRLADSAQDLDVLD